MWADVLLVLLVAACAVTDIRSRRIYNKMVIPAVAAAFVLHALEDGWPGLLGSLVGFAAGFAVLLLPYLLGGMGAGDVKLLSAVGALKGLVFVLAASVYMALLGGLMALVLIAVRRTARERMMYVLACLRLGSLPFAGMRQAASDEAAVKAVSYPYGIAIAGGALISLSLQYV